MTFADTSVVVDATAPTCAGPACTLPARSDGLCGSHYRQRLRHPKRALKPLRTEAGVQLPAVRVSQRTVAQLDAKGPSRYLAAQAVLEEWGERAALQSEAIQAARRLERRKPKGT